MSQRKVYVIGTVQPGLNANFRKTGFCGSMNTPQETKGVLDMLDKEQWAIPFDHLFYRDGVDESNPGELKMGATDVIGEFFGGVLTEKGDTVMIAELDFELDVVKKVVADTKAYRERIQQQLADGVPPEKLEKPPYGFSPQADVRFSNEDGVVAKDFKNISLVPDPEYGAEGAVLHGIGFNKEDLLRDLATNFVSKDAYVSPEFGAKLWSYRDDPPPPSSYTPQILIPVEDPNTPPPPPLDDDPMDVEVEPEAVEENDPIPVDPVPERPAEAAAPDAQPVSVFSSHGKSDPSAATEEPKSGASPTKPQRVAKSDAPADSSASVSPALVNAPTMSQSEPTPMEGVESTQQQPPAEPAQPADPLPPSLEPKDTTPPASVSPAEDREQQRARSAEKADDFFKRAQQRHREMSTIKSDSDRLVEDAGALLKEMDTSPGLIDFTRVASLLTRYQTIDAKIDELNLGRKEVPKSYTIATAKANDVLGRWNEKMNSAAKKNGMEDDLPTGMDVMMDEPTVLQANQQILKVFSKSLGRASPAPDNSRVNQRDIEKRAEEVRLKKQQEKKRPRENDDYVKQPTTPMDEKKRKVNEGLVELPRSRVLGVFSSKLMDVTVTSSRYSRDRDFASTPQKSAVTAAQSALRKRWIRLAQNANIY